MEQIQSNNGLVTWNVISSESRPEPSGTRTAVYYKVACSVCGHEKEWRKADLKKVKSCTGCKKKAPKAEPAEKPSAVKLDETGACISICEIGMVEFIRDYQAKHEASEREAVSAFVESAKASLPEDDPYQDTLTPESVRAKVRRATGKKDGEQERGGVPQENRTYKVKATVEAITAFIEEHLPTYTLTKRHLTQQEEQEGNPWEA